MSSTYVGMDVRSMQYRYLIRSGSKCIIWMDLSESTCRDYVCIVVCRQRGRGWADFEKSLPSTVHTLPRYYACPVSSLIATPDICNLNPVALFFIFIFFIFFFSWMAGTPQLTSSISPDSPSVFSCGHGANQATAASLLFYQERQVGYYYYYYYNWRLVLRYFRDVPYHKLEQEPPP